MIELGYQPVKVAVPVEAAVRNKIDAVATATAPTNRVVLNLVGIHAAQHPGGTYEVYINLPDGQEPDYRSDYYVGNLDFFGHVGQMAHVHGGQTTQAQGQPSRTRSFDITRQVRALQARGEWQGQQPHVVFVRAQLLPPVGAPTPPPTTLRAPAKAPYPVQLDQVTITTG